MFPGSKAIKTSKNDTSFTLAGATLAYLVGSGFASGQELMQYFVPYGMKAPLVALLLALILIIANTGFIYISRRYEGDIFVNICGHTLGWIFRAAVGVFAFLSYSVMLAGAGSAVYQQYGLPLWSGVAAMTLLTGLTVSRGLNKLIAVISRIGPTLALFILIIGVYTLIHWGQNIPVNSRMLTEGGIRLMTAAPNWWIAGLNNGGANMLILTRFMAELGRTKDKRKLLPGQAMGIGIYAAASLLMSLALLSVLPFVAGAQVPNLLLAKSISPALAGGFGMIIFASVYTTACPLLWTASGGVERKHGVRIVWLIAAFGSLLAFFIPFSTLVNIVYRLQGFFGIALLLCLCRKIAVDMRKRHRAKKAG